LEVSLPSCLSCSPSNSFQTSGAPSTGAPGPSNHLPTYLFRGFTYCLSQVPTSHGFTAPNRLMDDIPLSLPTQPESPSCTLFAKRWLGCLFSCPELFLADQQVREVWSQQPFCPVLGWGWQGPALGSSLFPGTALHPGKWEQ
jgi:hypothetical protein